MKTNKKDRGHTSLPNPKVEEGVFTKLNNNFELAGTRPENRSN
jgi:hypothetical protein